jgi:type I restriction enzyme, S subunit
MSVPRYEKYKDSGVAWLGEVPEHWGVERLKNLIDRIESGTSVNSVDTPAVEGEFGVLKTSCVYRGQFDPEENKAVVAEEYERLSCPVVAGTLIASRMNTPDLVGAAGVVRQSHDNLYLPDRLWQVHFKDADAGYVHYWTNTRAYRMQVEMACAGTSSSMQNLGQDAFRVFVLARPPQAEQVAIVTFLDHETAKIDALVGEQKRLIELLKEKRQAVISHAVTKGLNPNAPMKDSGVEWLGKVPAHWDIARLKFVAHVQTGVAKGKDNAGKRTVVVPYLRVANVQDGYLALDDVSTIEIPADDLRRYRLRAGDVLMNEGGDFDKLGRGHVWDGTIDPCIHQNHVFAVRPFGISPRWLNLVTSSGYAQFYFMSRSKQSTNLASISSTNIMELLVVIPPADEQKALLTAVDTQCAAFDQMIESGRSAIQLLLERRTALISAAVTGKIDVRQTAAKHPDRHPAC